MIRASNLCGLKCRQVLCSCRLLYFYVSLLLNECTSDLLLMMRNCVEIFWNLLWFSVWIRDTMYVYILLHLRTFMIKLQFRLFLWVYFAIVRNTLKR